MIYEFYDIVLAMFIGTIAFLGTLAGAAELAEPQISNENKQIYDLIQERGYRCLECHDVDKAVVGPAWREVAAKRRNHKWAAKLLAYKISNGSLGEYGTVQMPHNEVQEEDVRVIVNWILSLWPSNP